MITTFPVASLAADLSQAFEGDTRSDGSLFRKLRKESPEWMRSAVQAAHGDMLPDDWRYAMIARVVDAIADAVEEDAVEEGFQSDDEIRDAVAERLDDLVPVYNTDRSAWLASYLNRADYVDEAVKEYGWLGDIFTAIGYGMLREYEEVFGMLWDALEERAESAE